MEEKKTLLFDQDGVLANYARAVIEYMIREHPAEPVLREEEQIHFDTHKHFSEQYHREIEAITLREGFFANLQPIDGAVEGMRDLLALGYDVRICTAPKKKYRHCVAEKLGWIEHHLGTEFVQRTVLTRDKTLVRGAVLVDDKPEVVGVATPEWEHILFDQPYNRAVAGKRRLDWHNYREVLWIKS